MPSHIHPVPSVSTVWSAEGKPELSDVLHVSCAGQCRAPGTFLSAGLSSHFCNHMKALSVYHHCWGNCALHDLLTQSWRPESVIVCSPVGGASHETLQQPSVEHSVTVATDNAVKVAEQNRQAATEALTDVKQQIGQKE